MNLDEMLLPEKAFIKKVSGILEKEGRNINKGKEPNYGFWQFYKEFMRDFMHEHHHAKEEHLLKGLLEKDIDKKDKGNIKELLAHHIEAEKMTARLEKALKSSGVNNKKMIEELKAIISLHETKHYDHSGREKKYLTDFVNKYFTQDEQIEFKLLFNEYDKKLHAEDLGKQIVYFDEMY